VVEAITSLCTAALLFGAAYLRYEAMKRKDTRDMPGEETELD
jgi:hypothetical protein